MRRWLAVGFFVAANAAGIRAAAAVDHAVTIEGFSFRPASITIDAGDRVVWTHRDTAPHTVTSDDGTTFDSGNLTANETFAQTFPTAGTFPYHCEIHGSMRGTVVVRSAATTVPPTTTRPPATTTSLAPTTSTAPSTSTTLTTTTTASTTTTTIDILTPSTQASTTSSSTTREPVRSSDDDDGPSGALVALLAAVIAAAVGGAAWLTRLWRAGRL
jgi:plastocyanin